VVGDAYQGAVRCCGPAVVVVRSTASVVSVRECWAVLKHRTKLTLGGRVLVLLLLTLLSLLAMFDVVITELTIPLKRRHETYSPLRGSVPTWDTICIFSDL
jgi:hypothetical protein